ncbi:ABC transporter permease [Tardiphaga sp. P9-11]|nr:ABC transporter permease [Tardiphaga sp. P9-11]
MRNETHASDLLPTLTTQARDPLSLRAGGAWTVEHAELMEHLCQDVTPNVRGAVGAELDLAAVTALDTSGAWLLEKLSRAPIHGDGIKVRYPSDTLVGLLTQAHKLNRCASSPEPRKAWPLAQLDRATDYMAGVSHDAVAFLHLLGAVCTSLGRIILHPSRLRLTSTVYQLFRVGWQAIPIMVLITFLIGAIIAQQGIFHFRRFGAESYVVDMVGILVMREIGVLIVAIMVAGRSGSAYTAEIGAMKMREEIDALITMERDPIEVLIVPRVLALVLALPILAFLGSLAALYGGGLIAWLYGGMSPAIFIARLHEAVSVTHFEVGLIKAPFMALVIGIVAAMEGLRVKGSAESLGRQTTASVVKSIFLVIVIDGVFAVFFASIGM